MASTYLELVNKAIVESGADLDQLTAGTFASPPDPYHVKFKNWVNDAWKEIQLERDWRFSTQQANSYNLAGGFRTVYDSTVFAPALLPGRFIKGRISGTIAQVGAYFQLASSTDFTNFGTQGNGLLTFVNATGKFLHQESFNVYEASATLATVQNDTALLAFSTSLYVQAPPSYSIFSVREFPHNLDFDEVYITRAFTAAPGNIGRVLTKDRRKLKYLEYDEFRQLLPSNIDDYEHSDPNYFTITPDGLVEFYPLLPYTAEFYGANAVQFPWLLDFITRRTTQTLSAATDVPARIPEEYRDMIAWRAVMYYANDDSKPDKWRTANSRYTFYKRRLEEELIEQPRWENNPYKRGFGIGKR